jgi:predicted Zn finger-like uncharacterized protein
MSNPAPVHQCLECSAEFDVTPHDEGYDYGEVRFCPYCGTSLEEEIDEELFGDEE